MDGVRCVLDAKSILGEGALWDAQAAVLYWVDIKRREIHRFDPASGEDVCWRRRRTSDRSRCARPAAWSSR